MSRSTTNPSISAAHTIQLGGHVQIESGVSLILYQGRFSNEDFAAAVASVGKTGRFIMFPEHTGTIGNAWGGAAAFS